MSDHDDLEMRFWAGCGSTFGEESKQRVYLREMGFAEHHVWHAGGFAWDAKGRSIIDIGGGPVSALLKFENCGSSLVVDPGEYPDWVWSRYEAAGIEFDRRGGEKLDADGWDLALIYNCLQHTIDPTQVIKRAVTAVGSSGLRMFEWIDIPPHEGHPHMLTQAKLEEWTGRKGIVKEFQGENGCFGRAWILGGG
jgi:hypothetical protein